MIFVTLEHIFTHISFSMISILIMIHLMNFLVHKIIALGNSTNKGMVATFFSITSFLVIRWISSGHFPLSNLYESFMFLSWSFLIIHGILYFKNQKKNNDLSAITAPSAILTQAFATSSLSTGMHPSAILVPALQSQWLLMHVSMMVLSYAALLLGSLLSIALLVITFRKNIPIFKDKNFVIRSLFSSAIHLNDQKNTFQTTAFLSLKNYYEYQFTKKLDYWSYRVISLGFLFLTTGILSGAVWANEAWGSYWNWDPKETWAFITWTIYAIYLHTRTNPNFQGIPSAIVASIGFLIIWICYFGVNLLGIGLHSYGSFSFPSS